MTCHGIAYTDNGSPPPPGDSLPGAPGGKIIGWKQDENGKDMTWPDRGDALEACELDGWTGYVCEYPSGARPPWRGGKSP